MRERAVAEPLTPKLDAGSSEIGAPMGAPDEARLLNLAYALRAQHPLERSPPGVVCTPAAIVTAVQEAQKINPTPPNTPNGAPGVK